MDSSSTSPGSRENTIKVKFMFRGLIRGRSAEIFIRQFPRLLPRWGNCVFDFDIDCRDYDWLAVYQDIPQDSAFFAREKLACPREKTIFITGEPSTITVYGTDYLRQYGCILTFQEPWAIRHANVIFHHPGLMWFYGMPFDRKKYITWDEMAATPPPQKTQLISTVCSKRTGKTTLHTNRVDFTWRLKEDISELEIFGNGVRNMIDKAEALDSFKYHIAVENHVFNHHLTEKLPDAFLGYTLPFYHGAPNAADYFPKESFVAIDINDYHRCRDIIKSHLRNNEYEDRLPYIIEARRRVLEEQNLFAILSDKIQQQDRQITTSTFGKSIFHRRSQRLRNPLVGLRSLADKAATKIYLRLTAKSRNTQGTL